MTVSYFLIIRIIVFKVAAIGKNLWVLAKYWTCNIGEILFLIFSDSSYKILSFPMLEIFSCQKTYGWTPANDFIEEKTRTLCRYLAQNHAPVKQIYVSYIVFITIEIIIAKSNHLFRLLYHCWYIYLWTVTLVAMGPNSGMGSPFLLQD